MIVRPVLQTFTLGTLMIVRPVLHTFILRALMIANFLSQFCRHLPLEH